MNPLDTYTPGRVHRLFTLLLWAAGVAGTIGCCVLALLMAGK